MGEQANLRRRQNKELRERTASRATMFWRCLAGAAAATKIQYAVVAELADAPDLGSGVYDVQVQVLSPAPKQHYPNFLPIGEGLGFVFYINN